MTSALTHSHAAQDTTTTPGPGPARSLDEILVLRSLAMDEVLARASAEISVNTAHIETVEVLPEITGPVVAPEPPCPYTTPVAQLLHRAHARMQQVGWCKGTLRDEEGRRCLLGVLQAETGTGGLYDMAAEILYQTILRIDPGAHSVWSWSDAQATMDGPLLVLSRAARLASDLNK